MGLVLALCRWCCCGCKARKNKIEPVTMASDNEYMIPRFISEAINPRAGNRLQRRADLEALITGNAKWFAKHPVYELQAELLLQALARGKTDDSVYRKYIRLVQHDPRVGVFETLVHAMHHSWANGLLVAQFPQYSELEIQSVADYLRAFAPLVEIDIQHDALEALLRVLETKLASFARDNPKLKTKYFYPEQVNKEKREYERRLHDLLVV